MNTDGPIERPDLPIEPGLYDYLVRDLHYPVTVRPTGRKVVTVPISVYQATRRKKAKVGKPGRLPRSARKAQGRSDV